MSLSVELMIFDFDGTLVNSGEDIANSVNYTLGELKLPLIAKEEILTYIGDGVVKLIERATGKQGQGYQEQALKIFSEHYDRHMLDHAFLYPGVSDFLKHYQEKTKIILTNKRYRFTHHMASELGILGFFKEIIAADSTPFIKPDPQLIAMILKRYPFSKESTIIIGDGLNDIRLAKNSGIKSACYLQGLGKWEELIALNPDYTFKHFDELKGMIS